MPVAVGGALVIVVVVAVYFLYTPQQQPVEVPAIDTGPDVSAQVSGAVETPADKLPETNPFSDYKNPFE